MRWQSALAIYALFWALCLFLVLPFHAGKRGESGPPAIGHADSAPAHFNLKRAALQVTTVSAILFGLYYLNYIYGWITADDLNLFGSRSSG